MKIIAVIVTYNRLTLLKKSVQAVRDQSRPADEIIVINNGSTDDTLDWLNQQPVVVYSKENNGGAGGFSYGINKAYNHGADWIWLMDDDSIPYADCLEKLVAALHSLEPYLDKVGFLSSKVLWKDGNLHELNKTYPLENKKKLASFAFAGQSGLPLIDWGTFVSMLLSAKAVEKVGLPIKDFFIWCDDAEYSKRITGSGMAGFAINDSVVLHDTPTNHRSSVLKDPESAIWKYKYGMRNELFTKRKHDGQLAFWVSWTHRMFIMPFRIMLTRKNHQWAFIKILWVTSVKALFFHPKIERADEPQALSVPVNTKSLNRETVTTGMDSSG